MRVFYAALTVFLFFSRFRAEVNDRYYPRYHLAPPRGWMNDPNGFCQFKNEYHLFYQHNPDSSLAPGSIHWGHAKSNDLFHWEHLPIAMDPDQDYDRSGVFSGSAIVENETMYLFYTGHVNHPGQSPDHEEHQCLATSTDGITVTKYPNNPVLIGAEHQPDIRDPKVWKHLDTYYMVLGNSFNNTTLGRVLLYTSKDKITWNEVSIIDESDGYLGYMWECPDFFELDGHFILLFSPQGVKPEGDKYRNLYQTGYIVGDFDYSTNTFKPMAKFQELDHGHDFYATQTVIDDLGRRIVIAWFDMWDQNYPEQLDGFNGQMTIPRVLSLSKEGRIIQKPVREIKAIRGETIHIGKSAGGTTIPLDDNAAEISIIARSSNGLDLYIESQNSSKSRVHIKYDSQNGTISLDRGGNDGLRRTVWQPQRNLKIKIYIDASSIEMFCGKGEVTISSRFFPNGPVQVRLGEKSAVKQIRVTKLNRTVFVNKK
ncbi:sucrose-6-phosphate hydrolase-like [Nymphalis io]|uniref:sucrose-6-phosphate hydrolase-like n=1 Tax=Inachis io TaxID=171585 RepID=UPI00216960F7|nr:sucrose-6-phosphate hydrolase-like [Nymphalis io]